MLKIKYIKLFFVVILVITSLNSCKKSQGIKIGVMFPYTTGARFGLEETYFKNKAAELNCQVSFSDAKSDDKTQKDQAMELIKNGVNVLVIMAVNAYTSADIVRTAREAGIKVIAYDRIIYNCDLDLYLSYNNYNVGKYMADYALKLKPEGKYLILGGDKSDRNAIMVKTGQLDAIQKYVQDGKIKIVYNVYTEDWSADNAYKEMSDYLKLSSFDVPDVILSSYDGMSRGSLQAMNDLGIYKDVVITGQDAEPQSIKEIIKGKQSMTIYKPFKILAETAVIDAIKLYNGEKPETNSTSFNNRMDVPTYLFDPVVVDKSNYMQTVVADGLVKESDLQK